MINSNDPAFPAEIISTETRPSQFVQSGFETIKINKKYFGLTKREYFAAMALSVICWHSALRDNRVTPETIAQEARDIADALIAELSKETK